MDADVDGLRIAVSCRADDLLRGRAGNVRRIVTDAAVVTRAVAQQVLGAGSDDRSLGDRAAAARARRFSGFGRHGRFPLDGTPPGARALIGQGGGCEGAVAPGDGNGPLRAGSGGTARIASLCRPVKTS
jgi:hypothetical protein